MKRHFTQYWKNGWWFSEYAADRAGELLDHTAGNSFHQRGVGRGDAVYVVTVLKGRLYLLCRLSVARICSITEAKKILGTDDLWPAREHIIAASATPMRFDLEVSNEITKQLLFVSSGAGMPLRFVKHGYLDQQTLRGVRELEPASARLLDEFLSADTSIFRAIKGN